MSTNRLLDQAPALHAALLSWFEGAARDLPWRRRRSPYGTWISEMMLQQTTVAAVVPYWERFLARFPDVQALAAADEAEVLALWSGLGYYRRARMLHAAARLVARDRGGRLPTDHAGWAGLPGVGDYAAGAIASITGGERVPAVDANARRVLTRWAAADPAAAAALTPARLRELGAALVPPDDSGSWNEGLMELGATICRARDPRCGTCPVLDWCEAGLAGSADAVPPPAVRVPAMPVVVSMAVVRQGGDVLLLPSGSGTVLGVPAAGPPTRADLGSLHRGLWGLPTTPWYPQQLDAGAWRAAALGAWAAWAGPAASGPPRAAGGIRHAITRFRLAVDVVDLECWPGVRAEGLGGAGAVWSRWPTALPVSRLALKVIAEQMRPSG